MLQHKTSTCIVYIQTAVVSRQTFRYYRTREFGKGFCIVKEE